MAKIKDIDNWEKKNAVVSKNGTVLCPECKKKPAIITEYGMIRRCNICKDIKVYTCGYAFVDSNGRKFR